MTYDMGPGSGMTDPALVVVEVVEEEELMGVRVATVQQPAVGKDWSATPVTDRPFHLMSVRAVLTASAVVANRAPELRLATRDGEILAAIGQATLVVANGVINFNWAKGLDTNSGGSGASTAPLPDLWLPDGATIQTVTVNLDVGDKWSLIVLGFRVEDY